MTHQGAIARIRQKISYLTTKIEGDPDSQQSYWAQKDIAAFSLAIECLEYAQAMAEYEASQSSL